MGSLGRIFRFDDVRGYGFIAPSDGGDDVFFHANDFGELRHMVHPGLQVEFEAEAGDRGLKVAAVRIVEPPAAPPVEVRTRVPAREDDVLCDVLTAQAFQAEVTELLLEQVSSLTGAQIAEIRRHFVARARAHGWVEG